MVWTASDRGENMKRRLPASILAVLMMALIIVAAQTALGAPATTVRGDIPVEKLWDHGSLPAAQQPQSVAVKLMQGSKVIQQITLIEGADGRWTGVFANVPLFTNGTPIDYTVTEAPLADYAMTVVQLPFPGSVSGGTWSDKVTPASNSKYSIGDAEIVVANKGGTYDIWSLNTLNAVQQQALVDEINRANLQGLGAALKLGTGGNTEFRFGLPAVFYDKKGNSVEIRQGTNGREIEFGETAVWSLFYAGGITVEDARGAVIKNTYQAPTPTPTATPTPTPTPTATPTPTPTPIATPTPTPTPTATPTPTPTATPTPTPTPNTPAPGTPTPSTPEPEETPEPGFTPEPQETPEPDKTPEPQETPEPDKTPAPSTPTPDIVETGDSRNLLVWFGIALAAGAALLATRIRRYKRAK